MGIEIKSASTDDEAFSVAFFFILFYRGNNLRSKIRSRNRPALVTQFLNWFTGTHSKHQVLRDGSLTRSACRSFTHSK